MDIQDYLQEKQKSLDQSSRRIKDYSVFDFNYIPEKPLMRQEIKPVIDALLRYQQTGIANNILILGSRGSGKSLLARYLMKIMAEPGKLDFLYVNCRQFNTSFKILSSILGLRPRGSGLDEVWQKFTRQYPQNTVLILDEIDLIRDKDRRIDILYLLSRSENNYMALMLSNNPKFTQLLDESIMSTLQPELIHFSSYDAPEIDRILADRAGSGLQEIPMEQIRYIAARTCKSTNSDVRVAIKTLYLSALEPEVSLKDHFERARRDIIFDVVKDLNDKNLQILKAVQSSPNDFAKSIYQKYRNISVIHHEDPYSYMHFYSNLSYLQSLGLLILISTKVKRTYANRIQLTFDPEVLDTIWRLRFGSEKG